MTQKLKMGTIPLILVVIPSYKHTHLIGRTLQSIVDQSYESWEEIVVDNHFPDQADQVVQSFSDPIIKLLKTHNNGLIAASRNIGIGEAKGEWIAYVDSGDCWTSNKLQECMDTKRDLDLLVGLWDSEIASLESVVGHKVCYTVAADSCNAFL